MLFSSIPFLYYFLPVTLICYLIAPKKLKNAVLLTASLAFYAWGEKKLVLLFAFSVLFGWLTGLLTEKSENRNVKKALLIAAVVFDLGLLAYFKYADFFIGNFNALFGTDIPLLRAALPIGISFYTFQLLSYNIDVYRGTVSAQKNPIDFAAYVAMFPQLIAGPIVRYSDISGQLTERTHSFEKVCEGVFRFAEGLGKKVLIANLMGEIAVLFRSSSHPSILFYWMYAVSYALQIYFDFSGYSDMAIGLGKVFGFDFTENFNYPYISASVTEFWRRWHISLGSWFRDYVYIPLGGNRRGKGRQLFNILVVWMLTGLWHGASWNFVVWGLFYALLLTAEKLGLRAFFEKHRLTGHIYVILSILFGFVIFNAANLPQAWSDICGMFSFGRIPLVSAESIYYLRSYGVIMIIALICSTPLPKYLYAKISMLPHLRNIVSFVSPLFPAVLLIAVTAYLVDGSFNPFLYFRF